MTIVTALPMRWAILNQASYTGFNGLGNQIKPIPSKERTPKR
jgi:hypothetical protein